MFVELAHHDRSFQRRRSKQALAGASLAHWLHDGFTDALYAFLPVWQSTFALSFAGLAGLRALYTVVMGGLQLPASRLTRGRTSRSALVCSAVIASAGVALMAMPLGLSGLCVGLVIAGAGASIQHPVASMLVHESYQPKSSRQLGIYNFSGDLGKAMIPAAAALLLASLAWHRVLGMMAMVGVVTAVALIRLVPKSVRSGRGATRTATLRPRRPFVILSAIGALDTAVRMGYLLFLPFIIRAAGGGSSTVGVALALLFAGGAFGKATCAILAERLGRAGSIVTTETATAVLIVSTLFLPRAAILAVLPILGVVLNGTSSILYAEVPRLSSGETERGFAIFYTSVIGAGGVAPILFGIIADHGGRTIGIAAAAATALVILPLVFALGPESRAVDEPGHIQSGNLE